LICVEEFYVEGKPVIGLKVNLTPAPFLMIVCQKGVLACGLFNVEVANKLGTSAAMVTGVSSFKDMLNAKVVKATAKARELGVTEGISGREAVLRLT